MCGIAGIFDYSLKGIQEGNLLITKMNTAMEHRGPDDKGIWSNTNCSVFFGHQRLSILDLSGAGHQPMVSENASHALVFNGEIYNYKELRSSLTNNTLNSNTDTEVLLNLFIEEKLNWNSLRGMFALALWNESRNELVLASDRVGQKPLYYTTQGGVFAFSSQLKSLLQLPWIERELDEEALYHFLTFNHLSPPDTLFKGIKKFKPGHEMVIDKNGVKSYQPYWEIGFNGTDLKDKTEEQLSDAVYSSLKQSVDYRMISDVPVGAFLSGGVDSSAIVALMNSTESQPIKTYSIGFENKPNYDELKFAKSIADRYQTDHYERIVNPADFKNLLPKIIEVFDEPLADSTCIPIYFLAELAKENGTKVILTGDGADELFAGYSNWKKYINREPLFSLFSKLPKEVKNGITKTFGNYNKESPIYEMLVRASENQESYWSGAKGLKQSVKHRFLSEGFLERNRHLNSYSRIQDLKSYFNSAKNSNEVGYLSWLCYSGLKDVVPNYYLSRLDKLTMEHAVEGRSPFMDHDVINTAFSIPEQCKIKNNEAKYILKKSLERILPQEVLYRKKQGFCVPLKEWGGEIMIDYVSTNLHNFCISTDIFKENEIRRLVDKVKKGESNLINTLWTFYFFMNWHQKWIKNEAI